MSPGVGEPLGLDMPAAFPRSLRPVDQTRLLHDTQVFGDRLSRHVEVLGKPSNRRRPGVAQLRDKTEPRRVTEGKEHRRRVRDLRFDSEATLRQGVSR